LPKAQLSGVERFEVERVTLDMQRYAFLFDLLTFNLAIKKVTFTK
jgi:hypothetical protein